MKQENNKPSKLRNYLDRLKTIFFFETSLKKIKKNLTLKHGLISLFFIHSERFLKSGIACYRSILIYSFLSQSFGIVWAPRNVETILAECLFCSSLITCSYISFLICPDTFYGTWTLLAR